MQARPRLAVSDDADGTAAAAEPQKDGDAAAGGGVAFSLDAADGSELNCILVELTELTNARQYPTITAPVQFSSVQRHCRTLSPCIVVRTLTRSPNSRRQIWGVRAKFGFRIGVLGLGVRSKATALEVPPVVCVAYGRLASVWSKQSLQGFT